MQIRIKVDEFLEVLNKIKHIAKSEKTFAILNAVEIVQPSEIILAAFSIFLLTCFILITEFARYIASTGGIPALYANERIKKKL